MGQWALDGLCKGLGLLGPRAKGEAGRVGTSIVSALGPTKTIPSQSC